MDPVVGGMLGVAAVLVLLFLRTPVGVALSLPSMLFIGLIVGDLPAAATLVTSTFFAVFTREGFAVIPMFLVMGHLAYQSGIADDLFGMLQRWVGSIRGGLAMATFIACGMFGAVTGSSIATVATFSKSALPAMLKHGYSQRLAAGIVAASGGIDALIPPSTILVIFGLIAEVSIGQLLIAAILPGVLKIVLYILRIALIVRLNPAAAPPARKYPLRERIEWSGKGWPVVVIFGVVVGGIYTGIWTVTESAAAGVVLVIVIGLAKRSIGPVGVWNGAREGVAVAANIAFILAGAFVLTRLLALSGITARTLDFFVSLDVPPIVIFSLFLLVILVLGALIDTVTSLALTIPVMLPVLTSLGFDPIWVGVVMVMAVEIGAFTPPFGLNVYTLVATYPTIRLGEAFRGSLPFAVWDLIDIYILVAFPGIVTFLPDLAFG